MVSNWSHLIFSLAEMSGEARKRRPTSTARGSLPLAAGGSAGAVEATTSAAVR